MATLSEELQHAAKNIQGQIRAGLKPEIGSLVLLVMGDGGGLALGAATNLTQEGVVRALEGLLAEAKARKSALVLPRGGGLVQ